jgi:hypothetical protein
MVTQYKISSAKQTMVMIAFKIVIFQSRENVLVQDACAWRW